MPMKRKFLWKNVLNKFKYIYIYFNNLIKIDKIYMRLILNLYI